MPPSDDSALLAAHEAGDVATIVRIYRTAGDAFEEAGEIDKACFFLTHAYIWALEAGYPEASSLHARLVAYGREE